MKYNIPLVKRKNFYLEDEYIRAYFKKALNDDHECIEIYEPFLEAIGKSSAESVDCAFECDQNPPVLQKYNEFGEIQNKINYHSSYKKLKEASYGQGLLSYKYDESGLNGPHKKYRHQIGFMAGFIFSQVDTGLFCPICMTDSLAWVLENHLKTHPNDKKVKESLEGLTQSDLNLLFEGAMFLTERQGGSDVGANTVEAYEENGQWKIKGHKWFCSNVDAEVALVLARMPSRQVGTKGLGLFLLRRSDSGVDAGVDAGVDSSVDASVDAGVDSSVDASADVDAGVDASADVDAGVDSDAENNYEIIRLKDKLGVRSMASGEIDFKGTSVSLLFGEAEGFKKMAEMVNMSRIYNSIASLGVARRAIEEAKLWGDSRKAFGKSLNEHPLWKRQLEELDENFKALFELTFKAIKYLDAYENGDQEAALIFRVLTPVVKAVCGKFGVYCTSECMELIGGNAYIEEFKMAKLYRDVQVLPIWEGTTNIQALDLLRVFSKEPNLIDLLDLIFKNDALTLTKWKVFKKAFTQLHKHKDGGHKDGEHKDGEHKDGEHKDGDHKDGEHKDGEHKDGEHKDGELEAQADHLLFNFCDVWLSHLGHSSVKTRTLVRTHFC